MTHFRLLASVLFSKQTAKGKCTQLQNTLGYLNTLSTRLLLTHAIHAVPGARIVIISGMLPGGPADLSGDLSCGDIMCAPRP